MEENEIRKRSEKSTKLTQAALLLVTLLAIAVGVYFRYCPASDTNRYDPYAFDTNAMEGRIDQMSDEELQSELDRMVEEGMFNISIASAIVFRTSDGEGEARIENVASNRYNMQVDIFLDDTGECIYSSQLIRPGYSIEKIHSENPLPPGEYEATAVFTALTLEENQQYGQAAAQIRLYVLDANSNSERESETEFQKDDI